MRHITSQIMGRGESEDLSAAQIMYPVMQCADIFFLKVRSLFWRLGHNCWVKVMAFGFRSCFTGIRVTHRLQCHVMFVSCKGASAGG